MRGLFVSPLIRLATLGTFPQGKASECGMHQIKHFAFYILYPSGIPPQSSMKILQLSKDTGQLAFFVNCVEKSSKISVIALAFCAIFLYNGFKLCNGEVWPWAS